MVREMEIGRQIEIEIEIERQRREGTSAREQTLALYIDTSRANVQRIQENSKLQLANAHLCACA